MGSLGSAHHHRQQWFSFSLSLGSIQQSLKSFQSLFLLTWLMVVEPSSIHPTPSAFNNITTTFGNGLNKVLEFWIEIEKDQ
jgi:hypothetical protein